MQATGTLAGTLAAAGMRTSTLEHRKSGGGGVNEENFDEEYWGNESDL